MSTDNPTPAEEPLEGGFVNEVVRVGDTVRRSSGPWTPAVHALLDHLQRQGFTKAPRPLGIDERGREILSYMPGTPAPWANWPAVLLGMEGPRQLGRLLRDYHNAAAAFVPPLDAQWRNPLAPRIGEIVRHGDFSPFNVLWSRGAPVGVIDWDFAQPGPAITDLAYLAWHVVPLQGPARATAYGFTGPLDRARRLQELCAAYAAEVTPAAVIVAAIEAIETERQQTRVLAEQGIHPWTTFAADGNLDAFLAEAAWIRAHADELTPNSS